MARSSAPLSLGNSIGATSGAFSGSLMLTPTQAADVLAGNTYLNIRSQVFPSGEVAASSPITPEPGSLFLLGAGSLAVIAIGLRHRKRGA